MTARPMLAAIVGLPLLLSQVSTGALAQTLEQRFAAPAPEAKPRFRWWWPGAAVSADELRRELRVMADSGFGGAEIQALSPNFVTLSPEDKATVNDYAEPGFFAKVRAVGEEARALGLTIDYTLGSSWPSGGGVAVPPEKAFTELAMARTAVTGGTAGPLKVAIPQRTKRLGALNFLDARVKEPQYADWGKRLDARARIVAVVAMKGTAPDLKPTKAGPMGFRISPWTDVVTPGQLDPASRIVLTDRLQPDGRLNWSPPPGEWQVFVFKQYASDVGVLGGAGRGPQLILDHMDPSAFAAHAARVGDPLGQAHPGIRSTFVDSLELMQDIHWGPQFLEEFRKRRGYDLTPYLPYVVQPGWMQAWDEHWSPPYFEATTGGVAERVRTDYRRTVSDLMLAGFVEPFVAWNRAHGYKAKFQAHGGAFDMVRGYGLADIPETEDLVHGGDPFFMRMARSAAHLYGRPLVSAESFVWKDRPYDVTPDEMRRRVDLLIAGGVNSMILHGMNYRLSGQKWPGWHAFQPSPFAGGFSTMLGESNPIWPALKPMAGYIARLQSLMQAGEAVVPVAWFYGRTGYYVGIEDDGAGKQAGERAFLAAGYDFDRINPDSIAAARVEGKQLVSRGGQRYPVLVLPPLEGIRADTAEQIAGFAKAGLPVFFTGRAPDRDEGLADMKRRDARVRKSVAGALAAGAKVVPAEGLAGALRAAQIPVNLSFDGDATDLVYVQRRVDGRLVTFVHNRGSAPKSVSLTLPGMGALTRWDALTGAVAPVATSRQGNGSSAALALASGESALLVLDPRAGSAVPLPAQPVARTALPADGWTLSVKGHATRQPFAQDFGSVALGDWRGVPQLANFAGTATYRRTIEAPAQWLAVGSKVVLDLGKVYDIATVSVNGQALPPAFTAPYRVDISPALKPGRNDVAVTIATVPQNAMIDPKDPTYKKLVPVAAGWVGPAAVEVSR